MTAWGPRRHGACSGVPRLRGIDARTGQAVASRLRHELLGSGVKGQAGRPPIQEVGVIHPGTWDQWRTGLPGHIGCDSRAHLSLRVNLPRRGERGPPASRTGFLRIRSRLSDRRAVAARRCLRRPQQRPCMRLYRPARPGTAGYRARPPTPPRSLATSPGSPMRPRSEPSVDASQASLE
jgi:hypothetical protein